MNNSIHFLNGKVVTEEELLISPRDLGFTRGYAVTDFFITVNHKPFKLAEHIDRLFKSAEIIGLTIPWTKSQVSHWVNETLNKSDDSEKTIKIIISGGVSKTMYQVTDPTIVIMIDTLVPIAEEVYRNGIKARAVKYKRPNPEAKHTDYVEGIKQLSDVKGSEITDIIYYDDNQVYEGAGNNIFAVIGNKLLTPKTNILQGVTRKILLETLHLSIPIEEQNFTFDELMNSSEVFLTGSRSKIRGVVEINGKKIGDGKVGEITKQVMKQYEVYFKKLT